MFTHLFAGSIAVILLKLICVALFGIFAFFIGREAYRTFKTNRLFARAWAEAVADADKFLKLLAKVETDLARIEAEMVADARHIADNTARVPMKLMTVEEAKARHEENLGRHIRNTAELAYGPPLSVNGQANALGMLVGKMSEISSGVASSDAPKQGEPGVNVAGEGVDAPADTKAST